MWLETGEGGSDPAMVRRTEAGDVVGNYELDPALVRESYHAAFSVDVARISQPNRFSVPSRFCLSGSGEWPLNRVGLRKEQHIDWWSGKG
ncbi:uncharacterized protein N7483_008286 [Penicillium malachiteum]|uniref:uncharacterized protein n=1 Tax=Penicillium malachiteum TaxID=1324776 RepID=UPI0025488AB1|nr:uncharacterized protein N7483_008286 [Penicillium malachiteum]KAJ5720352.1 hypothetical protein N7483_008286 [Penicillium malachiteum]